MDGKAIAVLALALIAALVLLAPATLDFGRPDEGTVGAEGRSQTSRSASDPEPTPAREELGATESPTAHPPSAIARPSLDHLPPADLQERQQRKRSPLPSAEPSANQRLRELEEALGETDPETRSAAVQELAAWSHPDPAVTQALLRAAAQDPSDEVRLQAVSQLMTMRDVEAIPELVVIAEEDPSDQVREAAVAAVEYLATNLETVP